MRNFISIVETSGAVTLYRGDAAKIEKFEFAKTHDSALFGRGIYLTDDPEIAADYTIKGAEEIVWPTRQMRREGTVFTDPRELTRACLRDIVMTELGWAEESERLKREFNSKFLNTWSRRDVLDGAREQGEAMKAAYQADMKKRIQKLVDRARSIFKKRLSTIRMSKMTTGEVVFVTKDRPGAVSRFEVPQSYLAKCINADRPMSDEIVDVMRGVFKSVMKGDKLDLRIGREDKMPNTFDEFIEGFKKHGSRYAWTENYYGGKGENPSIDILLNGTHGGYHVLYGHQDVIFAALRKAGYVGFSYDGGVRLSGTGPRGGGDGRRHNVYVLWDEDAVNRFRVEDIPVVDHEVAADVAKGIRFTTVVRP